MGLSLLAGLLVPALMLAPSAFLDRGPEGSFRWSAFTMALTAFDPFVWECARNSLGVASATALGSITLGVGLGWIAGPRRRPGLGPLWALCLVPSVLGPLIVVPSLASLLDGPVLRGWIEGRSFFGDPAEATLRWATLVWAGLAGGVPLIAVTTARVLGQVAPAWMDAASAVGASRRRCWLDLIWPILRPEIARASAWIFTLSLLEPAGPILLGLPRTLVVQMVRASNRSDQPTRASTLAVLAVVLSLLGRTLILAWGRASQIENYRDYAGYRSHPSFRTTSASRFFMIAWCFASVLPLALWSWQLLSRGSGSSRGTWPSIVSEWLSNPETQTWAINSLTTSGLAITLDLALLRIAVGMTGGWPIRLSSRVFRSIPPLALGLGSLATPWLLQGLAGRTEGMAGRGLKHLALELSPGRSPGFLLILALAALYWPMLAGAAEVARHRIRPSRVEASRVMGVAEARARRGGMGRWLGVVPVLPAFLAFLMATTNLAPALILTPITERRTLAPAILRLLDEAGPLDSRPAGPLALLLGLHMLTLFVAFKSRDDWPGVG